MVISAPMADSLEIITLHPVKKLIGIDPMGLRYPWDDSLDIIALKIV